jgi:hypothetical protein
MAMPMLVTFSMCMVTYKPSLQRSYKLLLLPYLPLCYRLAGPALGLQVEAAAVH